MIFALDHLRQLFPHFLLHRVRFQLNVSCSLSTSLYWASGGFCHLYLQLTGTLSATLHLIECAWRGGATLTPTSDVSMRQGALVVQPSWWPLPSTLTSWEGEVTPVTGEFGRRWWTGRA